MLYRFNNLRYIQTIGYSHRKLNQKHTLFIFKISLTIQTSTLSRLLGEHYVRTLCVNKIHLLHLRLLAIIKEFFNRSIRQFGTSNIL